MEVSTERSGQHVLDILIQLQLTMKTLIPVSVFLIQQYQQTVRRNTETDTEKEKQICLEKN